MKKTVKIIFMGTPKFAVPALKALHKNAKDVALVVTQPDRPKGRGRMLTPPPVKEVATRLGYDVIQPLSIRTAEFSEYILKLNPDIVVVVAFGHIIPKNILSIPHLATINVHASLLPKYRGAAPIQWAIIKREKETGVTTMLMDEGLDTGDILLSAKVDIAPDDTAGSLHDRLANLGADLLIQTLKAFETDSMNPVPQNHSQSSYAPLLKKSDGQIEWNTSAENLEAFIRGMTPWPGAFTFHDKKRLRIFKARPIKKNVDKAPGTVIIGFPDELWVATGKEILSIIEIQEASGRRLFSKDFLRGYKMPHGTVLK